MGRRMRDFRTGGMVGIGRGILWWALILMILVLFPAEGYSQGALVGGGAGDAPSQVLLRYLVDRLQPESADLVLDREPDASGRVGHFYVDLRGARLGGVRVERFCVEALDVEFNPVEEWQGPGEDPLEVRSVLQTYAEAVLQEEDINDDLFRKQVGEDDASWRHLRLDFSPQGIYASGYYHVDWIVSLNLFIELSGKLAIRSGREIWLEDYAFRINRLGVPDILAEQAVQKLQPILDLGRFFFPVKLKTLVLDDRRAHLASPVLPQAFDGAVKLRYRSKH
ncbi:MAG TPA: DUF2993 domain-containing protein [Synergistaceae bacterium]|nr:DUF2993 domain-containing protein [Synergistaceae bacterium]